MGDFDPSHLGTKNHWDYQYKTELKNYDEFGDEGEIWFGKSSEQRIIRYLCDKNISKLSKILDIGCGNGHLCISLAKTGFSEIIGIDYSHDAVNLSNKLAQDSDLSVTVSFYCIDILAPESAGYNLRPGSIDVVIDKGTFDAITLSPDASDPNKVSSSVRDLYLSHVHEIMKSDGKLIVTSCNWSSEELKVEFERTINSHKLFEFINEVPPLNTFTFGGASGATTVCLVFRSLSQ